MNSDGSARGGGCPRCTGGRQGPSLLSSAQVAGVWLWMVMEGPGQGVGRHRLSLLSGTGISTSPNPVSPSNAEFCPSAPISSEHPQLPRRPLRMYGLSAPSLGRPRVRVLVQGLRAGREEAVPSAEMQGWPRGHSPGSVWGVNGWGGLPPAVCRDLESLGGEDDECGSATRRVPQTQLSISFPNR